jgi:DNA-binding transcriptional MerR regulator
MMLTIGQLAAHVGVTIRAIRHYHQRGLLAEPDRDASGYRRYGAQAVVDLIRIKTLADAGVPLARIETLTHASPQEFADAIAEIDRAMEQRIRDLARHRRRIADLAAGGGEQLFLPGEVAAILDQLRELGVSERTVQIERDAWILVSALSPEVVSQWVREKTAAMADPAFRRLYLACDEAFDWAGDDPRLAELADAMVKWGAAQRQAAGDRQDHSGSDESVGNLATVSLMTAHITSSSPGWRRLGELASEQE